MVDSSKKGIPEGIISRIGKNKKEKEATMNLLVMGTSILGSTKFVCCLLLFFCVLNQNLINNGACASVTQQPNQEKASSDLLENGNQVVEKLFGGDDAKAARQAKKGEDATLNKADGGPLRKTSDAANIIKDDDTNRPLSSANNDKQEVLHRTTARTPVDAVTSHEDSSDSVATTNKIIRDGNHALASTGGASSNEVFRRRHFHSLALEDHRNLEGVSWIEGAGYGSKSKGTKGNGYYPTLPPINKICFTELAAIWWSWYFCHFFEFTTQNNSCPVQDKRVPAKTTFLFYDSKAQNCMDSVINERICEIPADHWIILPVAANSYLTDFVNSEYSNNLDTPEGIKASKNEEVHAFKTIKAKIDGNIISVPRYESQDLCSLEIVDLEGCTGAGVYEAFDGWEIFSDGYWLRIPPLLPGEHTIEVSYEEPRGCFGTKYMITVV